MKAMKIKLFFAITEMYKGGAEAALVNLLNTLNSNQYIVDLLIMKQVHTEQSLIAQVPSWVRVCDAGAINQKVRDNLWQGDYRWGAAVAQAFVQDNVYDVAFSYGEWCYHEFVAEKVAAYHKAIWIHTDITRLPTTEVVELFAHYPHYQSYIFAAEGILQHAVQIYPILRHKAAVIHNWIDGETVLKQSLQPIEDFQFRMPCRIVTIAHVRQEKGYLRLVETANILKKEGLNFEWLCLGRICVPEYQKRLLQKIANYGLQERVVFLGERANPYPYMCMADLCALLSDYEAIPLSISEAHILGKPVVATNTAGAAELIVPLKNGFICGFNPWEIAVTIMDFFSTRLPVLTSNSSSYLEQFSPDIEWETFLKKI